MDLKQLYYFIKVAQAGSFTRASIALGIAQPALSRHIRQLEVELRHTLFIRNGRGAILTEAGKLLLQHGQNIMHQIATLEEELASLRGAPLGRFTLGVPPSLIRAISIPLLREINSQFNGIALSLSEGLSFSMLESLRIGKIDAALLFYAQSNPDVELYLLGGVPLFFISPNSVRRTEITLESIASLPLVLPSRPNAIRVMIDTELSFRGLKPNIAAEIDSVQVILDLVAEGMGNAILPLQAISQVKKYTIQKITPSLIANVFLATSARRSETKAQKQVIELIKEMLPKMLDGISFESLQKLSQSF